MSKPESGMTTEQMFQEAYLAEQYLASGNPDFKKRGERILSSHKGLSATEESESDTNGHSGDFWKPNPDAGIDEEDPRSAIAYRNFAESGMRVGIDSGRVVAIDLVPGQPVDPTQPVH